MTPKVCLIAAAGVLATGSCLATATASAAPAASPWDFNGDGHPEVVVGAPAATVGGVAHAGTVSTAFGTSGGPDTGRHRVISLATAGVPGAPTTGGSFGKALASGDFNGDGYADLAVGAPGLTPDHGGADTPGRILVLYGSAHGLSTSSPAPLLITSGQDGIPAEQAPSGYGAGYDPAHGLRRLGSSLAVGDFNGDGYADLAAGQPSRTQAMVFSGSAAGLSASRVQFLAGIAPPQIQDPGPINAYGLAEFANSLAVGDLDRDGDDDLVVSARQDDGDGYFDAEAMIFHGRASTLVDRHDFVAANNYEYYSYTTTGSVAVGDVDGDGLDDVVLQDGDYSRSGDIAVALGRDGLTGYTGARYLYGQDSTGIPGTVETGDAWGTTVSVGDIDGDGADDIVVGAPGEDLSGVADAGAVTVLYGGAGAFVDSRDRNDLNPWTGRASAFSQGTPGVPGAVEENDHFGSPVAVTDLNGDGRADLLVASPGENGTDGSVTVLTGSASGVSTSGARAFSARTLGGPYSGSHFGTAVG